MIPRLKEKYDSKIVSNLQKKLSMKNKLMVPKFIKVILSTTTVAYATVYHSIA